MDFPALRSLAQLVGTPLEGENLARVVALLDSDETRPTPDPTGDQEPDADLELESYRIDATAVGVFRIAGECFVATAEFLSGPHADAGAAQKLAALNQLADQHGLDPYTADDLDPWELDGEVRTTAVHGGYAEAAQACQDGRRRLLGLLLASTALRRVSGWETDAVLLGRGYDYYILRTHRDCTIDLSYGEQPVDAYARYGRPTLPATGPATPSPGWRCCMPAKHSPCSGTVETARMRSGQPSPTSPESPPLTRRTACTVPTSSGVSGGPATCFSAILERHSRSWRRQPGPCSTGTSHGPSFSGTWHSPISANATWTRRPQHFTRRSTWLS
jgi:hypothetical protein